jgi:hypothetical protein
VDIAEYVDRALEARYVSQQAGITPQIEQLPIFGIHKEVFLALRYRLQDGQVCFAITRSSWAYADARSGSSSAVSTAVRSRMQSNGWHP